MIQTMTSHQWVGMPSLSSLSDYSFSSGMLVATSAVLIATSAFLCFKQIQVVAREARSDVRGNSRGWHQQNGGFAERNMEGLKMKLREMASARSSSGVGTVGNHGSLPHHGQEGGEEKPEHLVVLVHGLAGRPQNWGILETLFKEKTARNIKVFVSVCNRGRRTLTGVDVMGWRLVDEVLSVVHDTPSLRRISFISHSLGGLVARFAIGQLYHMPSADKSQESPLSGKMHPGATIAGLEPVNFITLATPHLGCHGNGHFPFLFKVGFLERASPTIAPVFIGLSGQHLFLADAKPQLLVRMTKDSDEGTFMSALTAFRHRAAYANVGYDQMVGWQTASIRRATEMKLPTHGTNNLSHQLITRVEKAQDPGPPMDKAETEVVNIPDEKAQEEGETLLRRGDEIGVLLTQIEAPLDALITPPSVHMQEWQGNDHVDTGLHIGENPSQREEIPLIEGVLLKEDIVREMTFSSEPPNHQGGGAAGHEGIKTTTLPPLNDVEEAMVSALQQVEWTRVDVSFGRSRIPWMAHSLIQLNVEVLSHVIENMEK
eukprot:TRINITY_DN2386_c0_g1_i2.p1 TRINITY_DN2386_c0_g1~~TRINITY_DN2386_c0_g1_i2.p1  ORF type:complete len:544 (-),score=59.24 TRINITY_DN2386_c0_g1_i2:798-2429(-)